MRDNFPEAENILELVLAEEGITKEEELQGLILKSEILNKQGNFNEGYELADKILKRAKKEKNHIVIIDAQNQKTFACVMLGKVNETEKILKINEKLFKETPKQLMSVINKRKALFFFIKAYHHFIGKWELDELLQCAKKSLRSAERSDHQEYILSSKMLMFVYHFHKGNKEKCREIKNEVLELAESYGQNFIIGLCHMVEADLLTREFKYDEAKSEFHHSISALEKSGWKHFLASVYNDYAGFYRAQLDLDNSIKYYEKSLELYKVEAAKYVTMNFLSHVYYIKGEFDIALDYALQSLSKDRELKVGIFTSSILQRIISILIDKGNLDEAKKYHEQLVELNEETDKKYDFDTKLTSGLILKASKSFRDWSKAIDVFESLLELELDSYSRAMILMNLTELLIMELEQTGEKEIFEQVRKNLDDMYSLAEQNQYLTMKIDISRLQASFALLEFNIGKAKQILVEILAFAKDKKLTKSISDLENDLEELERQASVIADLRKEKSPITNTLKHVKLANGIKKTSRDTTIEVRDGESGKIIEYRKLFALKI